MVAIAGGESLASKSSITNLKSEIEAEMYIRKDDVVEVVAGDDKGTRGKVVRVLRAKNQVVIEGVNRVYRHLKPSKRNPQGGRLSKEMPVDASNVMLIDPTSNKPTRVGVRYL